MNDLKIYDCGLDDTRVITQKDIDRLVAAEQTLGALLGILRAIVGPVGTFATPIDERLKYLRTVLNACNK